MTKPQLRIAIFGLPEDIEALSSALCHVSSGGAIPLVHKGALSPNVRTFPSPCGNDEGISCVGSGSSLLEESFLPEEERSLGGNCFGQGPTDPAHPANDA